MNLLETIKNFLDITWEDESSDTKITGIIDAGKSYLKRKAGVTDDIDFETDEDALILLKIYVMYARSNELSDFEIHYIHEIMSLRDKYEARELDDGE